MQNEMNETRADQSASWKTRQLQISTAAVITSLSWAPEAVTWPELCERLMEHVEHEKKEDAGLFMPGRLQGDRKVDDDVVSIDLAVYDLDKGEPLDTVRERVRALGCPAVIYSTHSHLDDATEIASESLHAFTGSDDASACAVRRYLIEKKHMRPEQLTDIEIIQAPTDGSDAVLVRHAPVPRHRIVIPLAEQVALGADKKRFWEAHYAALGEKLGLAWDRSCRNVGRAYYMPSCRPGGMRHAECIDGSQLPSFSGTPPLAAVERAAVKGVALDDNLVSWVGHHAETFEIGTAIARNAPHKLRGRRSSQPGVHIECPFEGSHSSAGGNGTFVVNASENVGRGMGIHCCHDHCVSGRGDGTRVDRVVFIREMVRLGWLTMDDLANPSIGGGPVASDAHRDLRTQDRDGIGIDVDVLHRNIIEPRLLDGDAMRAVCEWPDEVLAVAVFDLVKGGMVKVTDLIRHSTVLEKDANEDAYQIELIHIAKSSVLDNVSDYVTDQKLADLRGRFKVKQKTIESDLKRVAGVLRSESFRALFGILAATEGKLLKPLREFCERYAIISVSGKVHVLDTNERDATRLLIAHSDFEHIHRDQWFLGEDGKPVYPAKQWLTRPPSGTRFYQGGLVFRPGGVVRPDQFNLFRGFNVQPDPSGRCDLVKELINVVLADGDPDAGSFVQEFLMHMLAHPGHKPGTSLAIRGGAGDGKSILFETLMAKILGDMLLKVADQNLILGAFNEAITCKLLLVLEEAAFAGNRDTFERAKDLITGQTVVVNPKHKAPFTLENPSRIVTLSNNAHFVNIDGDDRRYTILNSSPAWKGTNKYTAMVEEINNGGAERFLYEALNRTFRRQENGRLVINSNLKTEAAIRQFAQSRTPLQKAIVRLIVYGRGVGGDEGDHVHRWGLNTPWAVKSLDLEALVMELVREIDQAAARRVTLHTIIDELHRHIGQTESQRRKSPLNQETRSRIQLPKERVLPPRRQALDTARDKGLLTQEEYDSAPSLDKGSDGGPQD